MVAGGNANGVDGLLAAAADGDTEAVLRRLEEGADPRGKDEDGMGLLHTACLYGDDETLATALAWLGGAAADELSEQDAKGRTPAAWAARNGHMGCLSLIAEATGKGLLLRDADGRDALGNARFRVETRGTGGRECAGYLTALLKALEERDAVGDATKAGAAGRKRRAGL